MTTNVNKNKRVALALLSTTALLGSLSLSSCQDYEPFDEATVHATMVAREFTNNFEQRYGKIDPNHTWGFGPLVSEGNVDFVATRTNIDNKNQWETVYHLQVPGWPDIYTDKNGDIINNGYHYVNSGDKVGGDKLFYAPNSDPRPSLDADGILPGGDVTDEEIQYVSWWFRTHKNPGKLPIHCSDYFIQEISSDNDRNSDGTKETVVGEYVKNANGDWIPEIDTNTGLEKTVNVDKFGLDDMQAKNIEGATSENILGYDHMRNFNQQASNNLAGVTNLYTSKADTTLIWGCEVPNAPNKSASYRNIQFYSTSGTEDFAVKCTQDNHWIYEYALVHLHFIGESGRVYDGYYLGFDYEMNNIDNNSGKRQYRAFDGYYSNWIVKLTPAEPFVEPNPYARRIMCEDLGNTFDFDFNDVVFDATYNVTSLSTSQSSYDVTITLRASGGTLPIYVGKDPSTLNEDQLNHYEAHHMMGRNTSSEPINVGKNSKFGSIATYHINMNSSDPGDIKVWVKNKDEYYTIANPYNRGNLDNYNGGDKITDESDAKYSKAPQKFAVPVGTRWMQECEFIENAYEYFPTWVQDANALPNGKPWYHNDNIKSTGLELLYAGSGDAGISGEVSETPAGPDYSEYGTTASYDAGTLNNNPAYFLPVSSFTNTSEGSYKVSIICKTQNGTSDYVKNPSVSVVLSSKESPDWSFQNLQNNVSATVLDENAKIVVLQFDLEFPLTNANYAAYPYFCLSELNGLDPTNPIVEIRIKAN